MHANKKEAIKMKFKSTLEDRRDKIRDRVALLKAVGMNENDEAHAEKINSLIRSIPRFNGIVGHINETVHTIQPSINDEDCKIAVAFILSSCSEVVSELIKEGMVEVVKKEV